MMQILGCLEMSSGWCFTAKHAPNLLANTLTCVVQKAAAVNSTAEVGHPINPREFGIDSSK